MMRALAIFLLVLGALPAQIRLRYDPERIEASAPITRNKKVGVWALSICNDYPTRRNVSQERIYMANPHFAHMQANRASVIIKNSYQGNKKLVAARVGEAIVGAGLLFTGSGLIAASSEAIQILGVTLPILHFGGDRLKGEVPDVSLLLGPTLDPVTSLEPKNAAGECVTRTVFSSRISNPAIYDAAIWLDGEAPQDSSKSHAQAISKEEFIRVGLAEFDRSVAMRGLRLE